MPSSLLVVLARRAFTIAPLAALCLFAAGCGKPAASAPTKGDAPEGEAKSPAAASVTDAADVKVKILDFDGIQKLVAGHKGKVVVMDAWSLSCAPCVKEFPHLVEMHKKLSGKGVACVSLSLDYDGVGKPEEREAAVLGFLKKRGATFDNVLSSVEADELLKKLELSAPPAVFVYDKQGKLRKRFDNEEASKNGTFTYAQVEALVAELLKEAS